MFQFPQNQICVCYLKSFSMALFAVLLLFSGDNSHLGLKDLVKESDC